MKWLTEKEVNKAALSSHEDAIRCSLKHWDQLCKANKTELREVLSEGENIVYYNFCALCRRYCKTDAATCGKCPLRPEQADFGCNVGSLWDKAVTALTGWREAITPSSRLDWWKRWQKNSKAMRLRLRNALKEVS